jgi:DNA-binding IclR family transcriptional regulator
VVIMDKAVDSATPEPAGAGSTSRSVGRVIEIFELLLTRGEPAAILDLAAALNIPKSTAYDLVRTLARAGYLERASTGNGYFLGRKLFELGSAYRSQVDLLKEGGHIVQALRDETGETVQLSVLENGVMLVLVKEETKHPIRIISRVGSRVPVNWAAAGRLLVSDLDDAALRRLLAQNARPSPNNGATTDIDALVKEIRRARAQGHAVELNEANAHAGCVAAPVIDSTGRCVAAISIVAPEQRLQKKDRDTLIAAVKRTAARLSHRLGGPPHWDG